MSDKGSEIPPPTVEDSNGDGDVGDDGPSSSSSSSNPPPAVTGVASSTSSLTEAEALLIDMMKRQATVSAPSGGAEILAGAKQLGKKGAAAEEDGEKKKHAFWDTQPMPHERQGGDSKKAAKSTAAKSSASAATATATDAASGQTTTTTTATHCPIVPNKPKSELRQDPYNMPKGFEWSDVDVLDPSQRSEVYDLLAQNYVEDDDCMFRFDYSREFLSWALTPPGFDPAFHLGVRSTKSNRLMAFITGVPAKVRAYEKAVDMVEINFLCVHKKLRSKRLAPVLIKEITRRVNHTGVFQAVYTAGVVLPVPVASCRYYHRSLDPKKLVDIGFSRIPQRMTMARMVKLYRLPAEPQAIPGLRPMTPADVPGAHKLLVEHLKKYQLAVEFAEDEFAHWLLPRTGVVNTYVASDAKSGNITDLCSFYHLPSTIIGHPRHSTLRAAYSFYNVATTVSLTDLMKDCLILAKAEGQDVFNALNLMENEEFLSELKFGIGDGQLQYYLYNWACPEMQPKDVGIVLL